MLTVLTIKRVKKQKWYKRIINYITPQKLTTELIEAEGLEIVHISLEQKNKNIPWRRIALAAGYGKKDMLFNKDIPIPDKYGISRFESSSFFYRLCENAALMSLKKANVNPNKIKISLYDPYARHMEMAELLLAYSTQLKVITNNVGLYSNEANRLIDEYGASIFIGERTDWISPCDVLIAPDKIESSLKIKNNTIVFTGEEPSTFIKGIVYYSYNLPVPKKYTSICPYGLSKEYFLSALYSQCGIYELGALVPIYCRRFAGGETIDKIAENIAKIST